MAAAAVHVLSHDGCGLLSQTHTHQSFQNHCIFMINGKWKQILNFIKLTGAYALRMHQLQEIYKEGPPHQILTLPSPACLNCSVVEYKWVMQSLWFFKSKRLAFFPTSFG